MNCRPGDLAVVVNSLAGNEGRIVRCVKFAGVTEFKSGIIGPAWVISPPLPSAQGGTSVYMRDSQLRPIRPGDISDEEVRDLYAPKVPEAA